MKLAIISVVCAFYHATIEDYLNMGICYESQIWNIDYLLVNNTAIYDVKCLA